MSDSTVVNNNCYMALDGKWVHVFGYNSKLCNCGVSKIE